MIGESEKIGNLIGKIGMIGIGSFLDMYAGN